MSKRRPRVIAGVGVLCFVAVTGVWLGISGDNAVAEADNKTTIIGSVTRSASQPVPIQGLTTSRLALESHDGVVQRLSVYLKIRSQDAQAIKVYLTSPSGTKVLVTDGAKSDGLRKDGLEGWFGADGLSTVESLDAMAGESASGTWQLTVDAAQAGELVSWSLTADLGSNTKLAGMETYGEYNGGEGCDCSVGTAPPHVALAGLFLLALLAIRRRS